MKQLEKRIWYYLPYKPYCSSDKTVSLIRSQTHAIYFPYIQLNNPIQCAWLIFDCDHSNTSIWEEQHLAVPNYIVINKESGHFHIGYAISAVAISENARIKPLAYLAAIQRTYTRLLNADVNFVGLISKNPLHENWKVVVFHCDQYNLSELQDAVGKLDSKKYSEVLNADLIGYERNCELFHVTRFYAYANIKKVDDLGFNGWFDFLLIHIEALNESYTTINVLPLPFNEIKGIALSVAKWTYQRKNTIRVKKSKLKLDTSQPLEIRQSLGAHYTASVKARFTINKLKKIYEALATTNKKITQKAVQEASGMSLRTVKTYWKQIKN